MTLQQIITVPNSALLRCLLFSATLTASAIADERLEFFEKRIRPVLVEHCEKCHAADARNIRGGLLLDSKAGWQTGGDSGPAVIPGRPDESLLLSALRHESFGMPPKEKLPDTVIGDFETWIRAGAVDPREGRALPVEQEVDLLEGRQFWSFQPIRSPAVPIVNSDWPQTPIDHFLADQHSAINTEVAADATADQVLRRLHFALVGLPPQPNDIRDFRLTYAEDASQAIATATDHLLASPRFGERWGRHWLDVTRFAESSGGGRSLMFPHAWRFRDYVIRSFNADKPFNVLVREHIAGDLLPSETDEQFNDQVAGSAYLALGPINYELQDKELLRMEVVDEQIDTVGRTFLGLTLGCARCHDHKFDPIPTREYYAIAGIFRSTQSLVPGNVSGYVKTPLRSEPHRKSMKTWNLQRQTLTDQIKQIQQPTDSRDKSEGEENTSPAGQELLATLQVQLKEHKAAKPVADVSMSVSEQDVPADWHVHVRGNIRNLGSVVERGFLSVASTNVNESGKVAAAIIPDGSSGRLQLADWVVAKSNPLTTRVYVNRVWRHLIGEGIVRTPDSFGIMGTPPTHPELLDYLASSFVTEDQWSTKRLIRRIVTSRIFRLASGLPSDSDPENQHLTQAFRRQLDAEALRDSMLQISGQLDLSVTGGRTISKITTYDANYDHSTGSPNIRSVYVPFLRNAILSSLDVFDTTNPNVVTGRRTQTVLPAQALFLLNSPFVREQAKHAASTFLEGQSNVPADNMTSIGQAWLKVLGRAPNPQEIKTAMSLLESSQPPLQAWTVLFQILFGSIDFRFID
jgi:hypothetical protein